MRLALLAVALIASSPTLALSNAAVNKAAEAAPAADAAPSAQPKEEKKVCKRDNASESRLASKKICMTADQWKAQERRGF